MASDTQRPPSLTVGRVFLWYAIIAAVVVPMRLLFGETPPAAVKLAACAAVAVFGATLTWVVYQSTSGSRDGLAVGVPIIVQLGNGKGEWWVLAVVTVVVMLPAAGLFGAWLRTDPPPPAA